MTMRSSMRRSFARPVTRTIRKSPRRIRPSLDVLETRLAPAVISPVSFTAGDQEVNRFPLTDDADWLTYNGERSAQHGLRRGPQS